MSKKDSVKMLNNKIRALKIARHWVEVIQQPYVCLCLNMAQVDDSRLGVAVRNLKSYVNKSLKKQPTFENYLTSTGFKGSMSRPNMKKYRLQWIDWMIASLEEDLAAKAGKK